VSGSESLFGACTFSLLHVALKEIGHDFSPDDLSRFTSAHQQNRVVAGLSSGQTG
jgi:hypothetical protein